MKRMIIMRKSISEKIMGEMLRMGQGMKLGALNEQDDRQNHKRVRL